MDKDIEIVDISPLHKNTIKRPFTWKQLISINRKYVLLRKRMKIKTNCTNKKDVEVLQNNSKFKLKTRSVNVNLVSSVEDSSIKSPIHFSSINNIKKKNMARVSKNPVPISIINERPKRSCSKDISYDYDSLLKQNKTQASYYRRERPSRSINKKNDNNNKSDKGSRKEIILSDKDIIKHNLPLCSPKTIYKLTNSKVAIENIRLFNNKNVIKNICEQSPNNSTILTSNIRVTRSRSRTDSTFKKSHIFPPPVSESKLTKRSYDLQKIQRISASRYISKEKQCITKQNDLESPIVDINSNQQTSTRNKSHSARNIRNVSHEAHDVSIKSDKELNNISIDKDTLQYNSHGLASKSSFKKLKITSPQLNIPEKNSNVPHEKIYNEAFQETKTPTVNLISEVHTKNIRKSTRRRKQTNISSAENDLDSSNISMGDNIDSSNYDDFVPIQEIYKKKIINKNKSSKHVKQIPRNRREKNDPSLQRTKQNNPQSPLKDPSSQSNEDEEADPLPFKNLQRGKKNRLKELCNEDDNQDFLLIQTPKNMKKIHLNSAVTPRTHLLSNLVTATPSNLITPTTKDPLNEAKIMETDFIPPKRRKITQRTFVCKNLGISTDEEQSTSDYDATDPTISEELLKELPHYFDQKLYKNRKTKQVKEKLEKVKKITEKTKSMKEVMGRTKENHKKKDSKKANKTNKNKNADLLKENIFSPEEQQDVELDAAVETEDNIRITATKGTKKRLKQHLMAYNAMAVINEIQDDDSNDIFFKKKKHKKINLLMNKENESDFLEIKTPVRKGRRDISETITPRSTLIANFGGCITPGSMCGSPVTPSTVTKTKDNVDVMFNFLKNKKKKKKRVNVATNDFEAPLLIKKKKPMPKLPVLREIVTNVAGDTSEEEYFSD